MKRVECLQFCLLFLLFSAWPVPAIQQEHAGKQAPVAASVLEPVYGPLSEQIVADFQLSDRKGIGIDLGSGPGNLIIELCRRTRQMHWINADINPRSFPDFMQRAREAGFDDRVSAIWADAAALPFHDNYAEIIVSRGSFQLWGNLREAFAEIYRVLKPGGVAFIGRGFPETLPVDIARKIRSQQRENESFPKYDRSVTARDMDAIMKSLKIENFRIRLPGPAGGEDVNYGIWLEFRKPLANGHRSRQSEEALP